MIDIVPPELREWLESWEKCIAPLRRAMERNPGDEDYREAYESAAHASYIRMHSILVCLVEEEELHADGDCYRANECIRCARRHGWIQCPGGCGFYVDEKEHDVDECGRSQEADRQYDAGRAG